MREHPQQPRVLELQLGHAGEHADPEIALAVLDQVVGAIKIEGRARAVGIALGQIPAVRIARGRTQRSQIRRVGIPRLDRDARRGGIGSPRGRLRRQRIDAGDASAHGAGAVTRPASVRRAGGAGVAAPAAGVGRRRRPPTA